MPKIGQKPHPSREEGRVLCLSPLISSQIKMKSILIHGDSRTHQIGKQIKKHGADREDALHAAITLIIHLSRKFICSVFDRSTSTLRLGLLNIEEEEEEYHRVMGRFCCFRPIKEKKKEELQGDNKCNHPLSRLVYNISFQTESTKHRAVAEEILKIGNGNPSALVFTFTELAAATNNFNVECLLGEGGFGRVYKGYLEDTNQIIAVKQLDRNGLQGNREFLVEVLMLSLLHHQNLVNLIGYCADGDQRVLVYEYMPLGSLEDHLLDLPPDKKPLDWITRMKIAQGAAKGLEYLHDTANPPVIYRDFKASNILLDENYNPKLSDFGLAKVGPIGDKTHVSTRVMGTYGYCAPEYAMTGQLTTMSDVYSFGVVFLEIITGRRVIDTSRPSCEQNLVQWAEPLFRDKRRFAEMADPTLEARYPIKGLYQALAVAAMCLQEDATTRPLMSDVVTALEYLALPTTNPDRLNEPVYTQRADSRGSIVRADSDGTMLL